MDASAVLGATVSLPPVAVEAHLGVPQPTPGADGRIGAGFAATPDGAHAVLYGGGDVFNGGAALGDTWVWDGSSWTLKCGTNVACGPGQRLLVGAATSPTGVVLYGGQSRNGQGNNTLHGDMWRWNGTMWNEVCASCAPGGRAGLAMAGNGTAVMMFGGGNVGNANTSLADTWALHGNTWTRLNTGGTGQPAARIASSMAWDGQHFVLFGGLTTKAGNANNFALADTWIWSGTKWVQQCGSPMPACGPTGRILPGFAALNSTDPTRRGLLLVGGLGFPNGTNGNASVLGDIWFWNTQRWVKQVSPWPDTSPIGNGAPPIGLPFVGALAAMPALCQATLAADFPSGASGSPVIRAGTWNLGFDANTDHHPDACPASVPIATVPTSATTQALVPAAAQLPRTGIDTNGAVAGTVAGLVLGGALVAAARRARSQPR